jgi:hypothetical protein
LLDIDDRTFPEGFKRRLAELINKRFQNAVMVNVDFKWNVRTSNPEESKSQVREKKQRDQAFFLCRSVLLAGKVASYGEQFYGLYVLSRSLAVVFTLSFAYHLGWALFAMNVYQNISVALVITTVALIGAIIIMIPGVMAICNIDDRQAARIFIGLLMLVLFLCPIFLKGLTGEVGATDTTKVALLLSLALADALFISRSLGAYKPFARQYAKTIYEDFYAYANREISE